MNTSKPPRELVLVGSVTEVIHSGFNPGQQDQVTLSVEGAQPLWAELRLPNKHGWAMGQRVVITIAPAGQEVLDVEA